LDAAERLLVTQRAAEIIPSGQFDLEHLRAIHWHLFQDLYEWAGHIRTTEISKNGQQFQFRRFIETGMSDIHRRLETADHLKNLSPSEFTKSAGRITGDLNYVHPFREGNGRAQLQYLKQLAEQAGHPIDLLLLDPAPWLEASRAAYSGDYTPMSDMLASALAQN
jgi:cell filamentation protein